ncbi:uncharacterized protein LOC127010488 isoform X2 [Drosophila biarmipes]|nr:uncharacterized protein LOC127010488 isoform X2 [Drosophila biarmipes]
MALCQRSVQALESRGTRGALSYRRRVCRGIHPLKMSTARIVSHSKWNRRGHDRCRICKRSHHTLLRMTEPPSTQRRSAAQRRTASQQRSRRQDPQPAKRLPLQIARHPPLLDSARAGKIREFAERSLLRRAIVILETGLKTFVMAALIDPCTPTSCIDASLASAFRLPTTSVGDEKVWTATVRSKVNEGTKLEVILKVKPNVRIRTPIRAIPEMVVEKSKDLPLAVKWFYLTATISLILGAEVYSSKSSSQGSIWSTKDEGPWPKKQHSAGTSPGPATRASDVATPVFARGAESAGREAPALDACASRLSRCPAVGSSVLPPCPATAPLPAPPLPAPPQTHR